MPACPCARAPLCLQPDESLRKVAIAHCPLPRVFGPVKAPLLRIRAQRRVKSAQTTLAAPKLPVLIPTP